MSDFLMLSQETRAAFRQIDQQFMRTGRYPATRSAARSIAEKHGAPVADVLALSGFPNRDASAPARRVGAFLHPQRRKK